MDEESMYGARNTVAPGADETDGGPVEQVEGVTKRFVLAGIGAAVSACDTAAQQYNRFVARGQQVQNEWQEQVDEARRRNAGARGRVRDSVRDVMDAFLNGLNVPSKGDIDTINVKLNVLSRKLDDIQLDQVRSAVSEPVDLQAPPPPPPTTGDLAT